MMAIASLGYSILLMCAVCVAMVSAAADDHIPFPERQCNGRGILYSDSPGGHCECFPCFYGAACEHNRTASCVIQSTGGNPELYSEYWERVGDNASTPTPAYYRTPYQFRDSFLYPDRLPLKRGGIGQALRAAIFTIHAVTGNAVTDGYSIVVGHGGTQLINAVTYAYAQVFGQPVTVFAKVPYFQQYKTFAEFNPLLSRWNGSYEMPDERTILEFVTYPNNPNGEPRQPHYQNATLAWDMVYYWPSLTNVDAPASHDVMMFSMSKLSGHAGSRLGWALVRDPLVAAQMASFIGMMNIHTSIDAEHRALHLLSAMAQEDGKFFSDIRSVFQSRWARIQSLFDGQTRFKQHSVPGGFYVWIECLEDENCYDVFLKAGIEGEDGVSFGATEAFVRLEIAMRSSTFQLLIDRLEALLQ